MVTETLKVGFIGLGLMGAPMAANILKKGFPLVVYNRTKEKTAAFVSMGATIAASPADLAAMVDVVITMVTAGKDVEALLLGSSGVVKGAKKGLIVIDMSTIGPSAAKRIGTGLSKSGISFLDAPVTGSTPKAITGELTIFVGGKEVTLQKVRGVFAAMGTNVVFMGPTGSGQAIKLINNYLLASYFVALSESMLLADGMQLSREKVAAALLKTPNVSPTIQFKLPNYVKDDYSLAFSLANMHKDVHLAFEEMKKFQMKLPGLTQTNALYERATTDGGLSGEDFTAIIKEIEKDYC